MKWFKHKVSICRECGVHYAPVIGYEAKWGHLCPTHRKPVIELDLRKEAVISWASQHWEKLEPMYLKEIQETKEQYNSFFQKEKMDPLSPLQNSMRNANYGIGVNEDYGNRCR